MGRRTRVSTLEGRRGRRPARTALWAAVTLVALVASASAAAGRAGGAGMDAERVRRELRGHTLRTPAGATLALGALRGEVVVVNFWASWCAPCRKELPRLDALHASIAARGGRVLAVSIDQEARNVQRFVRTHRLSLPVYHDGPDGLARKLDLPHVPYTIVLDRDGNVALTTEGADEKALEAIAATTRRLLAAAPAGAPTIAGETP
jgi:thiol-disulfide isomerase/thioredoxin